jgi:hypothetical protein
MNESLASPPVLVDALLNILVPPERYASVSGDLLEEYREVKVPQSGRLRADIWYLGQVGHIFWRIAWPWVLMIATLMITSDLLNSLRLEDGSMRITWVGRAWLPTMVTLFFLAGFQGGRHTAGVAGGVVIAVGTVATCLLVISLWWTATVYPLAQTMRDNPYWIQAWHWSDSPGESFVHWLAWDNVGALVLGGSVGLGAAALVGAVGGAAGRWFGPTRRQAGA